MSAPWQRIAVAIVAVAATVTLGVGTLVVEPVAHAAARGADVHAIGALLLRGLALAGATSLLAAVGWTLWTGAVRRRHLALAAERVRGLARGEYGCRIGALGVDDELGAAIEQLRDGLDRAVRDQAEAVAVIAHDLRSPLVGIGLAADRLARGGDAAALDRARAMIERESGRIAAIADEMLELGAAAARDAASDRRPLPLGVLLDDVAERVRAVHARRVEVRAPRDAVISAAAAPSLARSLANLAENAARHAPVGGAVRLEAEALADGGVAVAVEDDGPGLDPALAAPFRQGAGARGRAGLGLASVRRAADRLGAELELGRHEGGGTRVRLSLPGGREPWTR